MTPPAPERPPGFGRVKQKVLALTGLDYYRDRDAVLADRIGRLAAASGMDAAAWCRSALGPGGEARIAELAEELAVGETYFFRYPEQLAALRETLVPDCIARRGADRRLRIWSAGCASGAEPYTMAILLRTEFARALAGWDVAILGTDISRRALARAEQATYSPWELRTADEETRRRHFERAGSRWHLRPEYRAGVHFEELNLARGLDAVERRREGTFDIILCRNVMIYFAPALAQRLIRCLAACLAPGGWLLVGHAEPFPDIAEVLAPVRVGGATAYRRPDVAAVATAAPWRPAETSPAPASGLPEPAPASPPRPRPEPAAETPEAALATVRRLAGDGAWDDALAACERMVERFPLEPAGHYACALIAEHGGDAERAEAELRRAIYLDRRFALAHYHLGRCQLRRGAAAEAARSFANALASVAGAAEDETLAMGDGLTVGDLGQLVAIHADLARQQAR